MRECYSCNKNSDLKNIINIDLKLCNEIKLNNKIRIMYCNKCNNYFNDSGNTQDEYDNYYKFFANYKDEISTGVDKNTKCAEYLLNNLNNMDIKNILNYGCGDKIISNYLEEKYNVDNYDIGMEENKKKYDCLIISHVFEHIYDLEGFINKIIINLNEDGIIYIEVPNAEYYAEITDLCPLQEINLEHINFFSKYSLSKLMINNNFIPLKICDDYFNILDKKYYIIRGLFKLNRNNKSFENYINNSIDKLNKINISNLKNLYIYGCGQLLFKLLNNNINNCEIINIIDDNPSYLNKKIDNIEIINYEILKDKIKDNDNILISTILNIKKIKDKLILLNKNINIIEIVI